ncbi:MAG: mechanosensitive ion channel [Clostridia bacterium]|nr:mechanosensitive ion channel [Clostridia bacterium]
MEQILNDLSALIVPFAKDFVAALVVFFVGFKVVNFITKRIKNGKLFKNLDKSAASFIGSFISIFLKIVVIVSVVAILGVPMSSVVALIASAGVAIGLAVQGALSNLVGGMMILLFRPFRVGDHIEAEGASGKVREISVFYTVVATFDNKIVTVPNGTLTNSVIVNYSIEKLRRVDVEITADYDSDAETVKQTILDVAFSCEFALSDPAPVAMMTECGDSAIKYVLRVWCENADYWKVREFLLIGVRKAFKNANIEIPYPQLDVRIRKDV